MHGGDYVHPGSHLWTYFMNINEIQHWHIHINMIGKFNSDSHQDI
jgi:hypothetical protein